MKINETLLVFASLAAALMLSSAAGAQDTQTTMQDDDASRAQLFQHYLEPEMPPAPPPTAGSFSVAGPFVFPDSALKDGPNPRVNSIFGIDLSHWSTADSKCHAPLSANDVDLTLLASQSVRFVYVKATEGAGYRDCRFGEYWSRLAALHGNQAIPRGAYHFLNANADALAQARWFIRAMQDNGGFQSTDLPPVLDLEWDVRNDHDRWADADHTPQQIIESVKTWMNEVTRVSGKTPILYTSRQFFRDRHITAQYISQLKPYRIWIADYDPTRRAAEQPASLDGTDLGLWQFSARGSIATGWANQMDVSVFKGTETEFRSILQLPAPH